MLDIALLMIKHRTQDNIAVSFVALFLHNTVVVLFVVVHNCVLCVVLSLLFIYLLIILLHDPVHNPDALGEKSTLVNIP